MFMMMMMMKPQSRYK